MNRLGLLGFPLGHSFSPNWWKVHFENLALSDTWSYQLFEVSDFEQALPLLKTIQGLRGFNVTIPYKERVLEFCTELSDEVKFIGAANTIKVMPNYAFKAFNTDGPALRSIIEVQTKAMTLESAIILGTGGSGKAASFACESLGIPFIKVSRFDKKGDWTYQNLPAELIKACDLIIQTTPLGMYPNEDAMPPLPIQYLRKGQLLIDLIYRPAETLLMKEAQKRGVRTINGMAMLELQAKLAWEIFKN